MRMYDFIIIGGGVSGSYVTINLIRELILNNYENKTNGSKIKILMLDKDNENFACGLPYGNKSDVSSLIITDLDSFLPNVEKESFKEFILDNIPKFCFEEKIKKDIQYWYKTNKQFLKEEFINQLYVPRRLYGQYLKYKLISQIRVFNEKKLGDFTFKEAMVTSIKRDIDYFIIKNSNNVYLTKFLVLCIGSMEKKNFKPKIQDNYIQNIYYPSLEKNRHLILTYLKKNKLKETKILIIGANAACFDFMYSLAADSTLKKLIKNIDIISHSGEYPDLFPKNNALTKYDETLFKFLSTNKAINSAQEIFNLILKEIEHAKKIGFNSWDYYKSIISWLIKELDKLPYVEKRIFVDNFGIKLVRKFRRVGRDYSSAFNYLRKDINISIMKGNLILENDSTETKELKATLDNKLIKLESYDFIINCQGFETIKAKSDSYNINGIEITNDIAKINGTGRGFKVNSKFESSPNCFIMGPLLAGYISKNKKIWHLENTKEIINLSKVLAKTLFQKYKFLAKSNL